MNSRRGATWLAGIALAIGIAAALLVAAAPVPGKVDVRIDR